MSKNYELIPRIDNYNEARSELIEAIDRYDSLAGRANIYLHVARLYKELAETSNDPKTKRIAEIEGSYFIEKALSNKNQREMQDEMLPDCFNTDKPISRNR